MRWKAAIVFDKADGKPILHTHTHDLSVHGAAIQSEYGDLTGTQVTVLLAQPTRQGDETPKMLKVRARVVSTVQKPGTPGYRHGLSFLPAPNDGLDMLSALLSSAVVAPASEAVPVASQPAAAPSPASLPAPAGAGRLERLRQLAQAKLEEQKKVVPPEEMVVAASEALQRAYKYLKELTGQLNVVKEAYIGKGYAIVGVPDFSGFVWDSGKIDLRTKEVTPEKKLWEQVSVEYSLSGNKQLSLTRDYPASEQLKRLLTDNKIKFSMHETRTERGAVSQVTFGFPCEVQAAFLLSTNYETGKLLLKMQNVEHFGTMEYVLAPEAIDDASLDELTAFVLGETNRIGPLLLRGA